MVETIEQAPAFDTTSGNWLCLDFTHTLEERYSGHPEELLKSYSDLVSWGQHVHILKDDEAGSLREEATSHPVEASAALGRAIVLREAIYRIFLALAEDALPREADLAMLNAALSEALSHARIVPKDGSFAWDWAGREIDLNSILWQVVRSAADLLTDEELDDVRACAAEDCRWLFVDTSKNRSRRWCDMKTCGNRSKARRHYRKSGGKAPVI
jgi:predicted RNA-binding Zn ribbon-like protein